MIDSIQTRLLSLDILDPEPIVYKIQICEAIICFLRLQCMPVVLYQIKSVRESSLESLLLFKSDSRPGLESEAYSSALYNINNE